MMATPPEHEGSPIRCNMCGKENPAGTLYCELCGSALKPVTPSSQPEAPPPGENEPTLDLLAQLRAEIEADSEATVIHKPGSGKTVADLINEMEPDFVFGSTDEEPPQPASGNIPDWLSEIGEPDDTGGESSDWLTADTTPSPSTPDWLQESLPNSEDPNPPVEDGVPDWLAESINDDSDSEDAAIPSSPAPTPSPSIEEAVPDWLSESLGSSPAPTVGNNPSNDDDDMPDWLAEGLSDDPLQPSGPPPAAADVPDWLPATSGASPVRSAIPGWLPENRSSQPAVGSTPDWLPAKAPVRSARPARPAAPAAAPSPPPPAAAPAPPPPPAPKPEPSEAPAESDVPDWLMAGDDDDLPDWLKDASPAPPKAAPAAETPPVESAKEEPASDLPDWLSAGAEASPVSEPEPAGDQEPDLPDWLSAGAEASPVSEPEPAGDQEPDLPDWLSAGAEVSPVSEPEPTGDQEPDLPDWLSEGAEVSPVSEPEPTGDQAPDLPDWLSEGAEAPAASKPEPTGESAADLPDWLTQAASAESDVPPPPPAPRPVSEGAAGDLPDWLLDASPGEPVKAGETTAPSDSDDADLPDWLMTAGEEKAAQPEPSELDVLEDDEWLGMLDQDKAPAEPAAAAPAPRPRSVDADDDLLGFMDTLGIGDAVPPVAQDMLSDEPEIGFDGLPSEEEKITGDLSDLPGWGQDEEARPDDIEVSPELLEEIGDLRFEAITGRQPQETDREPELVGALKDVSGVIQPELIFEGGTLRVGERLDTLITSNNQAKQVMMLEELLARETSGEQATERKAELPLVRWVTTLILLLAIAIPSLTGISMAAPTKVPKSIIAARQQISSLPPNANVLVAFEYEPDTAAEMDPLVMALLNDLANRSDITVYTVSTQPTGPAMAHRALQSTSNLNGVNLGYIAGGRNGINALTIGSISSIPSPLATDYAGDPTGITGDSLITMQPSINLIMVVAARQEHLQAWVEQAGKPTGIPIIAATSASSAPMAYPYQQSGQLVAVISGINEAAAYPGQGQDITLNILSAQAFGAVVAVIGIIVGTVLLGLRAIREQQEQVG